MKSKANRGMTKKYGRITVSLAIAAVMALSVPIYASAAESVTDPTVVSENASQIPKNEIETEDIETVVSAPGTEDAANTETDEIATSEKMTVSTEPATETGEGSTVTEEESSAPKEETPAPKKDGVIQENGQYFYYVNDVKQTKEGKIDWNQNSYYVTNGGAIATDQMVSINKQYFYAGKDGKIRKSGGWITVKGEQYLLKSDGHATVKEWIKDNKGWRWFDETGKIAKNKIINDGGKYYFLKADTYMASNGWGKDGDKWFYAEASGSLKRNQWLWSGSEWYYLKDNCYMAANEWVQYGSERYWMNGSGKIVRNSWILNNGEWYFMKSNGFMAKNEWVSYGSYWYWMDGSGKITRNKWIWNGGHWYYLKDNGYMAANEWFLYKSNWYWLNTSGAMAANQWVWSGSSWYYIKGNGCMAKGEWIKDGYWYYLNNSGQMLKNQWLQLGGYWYYLKAGGNMAANEWVPDGGSLYWVNSGGVYTHKASGSSEVQSYSSNTNYLITVDRSAHIVTIYYGSKWNWSMVTSFACGNGKSSTPTISGEFSIPNKYPRSQPYFDSGSARCWYPTRITGGYLFHSVLYYQSGSPSRIMDGRLGVGVSHGCVRLALDNAKYIYDNIPIGTKVVIW